jgi:hypothetical protein
MNNKLNKKAKMLKMYKSMEEKMKNKVEKQNIGNYK